MEFSVAFPHKHVEYIDQIQTLFLLILPPLFQTLITILHSRHLCLRHK